MKTLITILPLLLCMAMSLQAQEYDRVVKEAYNTTSSPDVTIDTRFGTVHVNPAKGNTVTAVVAITVGKSSEQEAKKLAQETRVEITGNKNKVTVRTALPSQMDEDDHSISIDVTVTMPPGGKLDLESKFGDVYIKGITGSVVADCGFGSVEITKCANVRARNSFGDITLAAIKGKLELEAKMGEIIARHIDGGKISSSYGDVEISDVTGSLDVTSSMGSLTIKGMRNGEITSSYGSIELTLHEQFAGRIEATSSFGSIDSDYELKDKGKKGPGSMGEKKYGVIGSGKDKLVIKSSFGSISIEK